MIQGLKTAYDRQPIITDTEQLYFRGKETMVSCDAYRRTKVEHPIPIEEFLNEEALKGNGFEQDFILATPKQSTLQPEGFKGRVAIDQYGFPMDLTIQVDNSILTIPKIDSYAASVVAPDFQVLPSINLDVKNALKNSVEITNSLRPAVKSQKRVVKVLPDRLSKISDGRAIDVQQQYKTKTPNVSVSQKHMKERLDMAIARMDFSEMKKQGHTTINKKVLRDRIQLSVETITNYVKDPKFKIDLERHMRENVDIMSGVLAYIQRDPEIRLSFENYLKDHQEIFANFTSNWGQTADNKDKDLLYILREKNQIAITASIVPNNKTVEKEPPKTCYLDDRFVSWDQLEPMATQVNIPQPAIPRLPPNCRR